jgi:hypothetical protein
MFPNVSNGHRTSDQIGDEDKAEGVLEFKI